MHREDRREIIFARYNSTHVRHLRDESNAPTEIHAFPLEGPPAPRRSPVTPVQRAVKNGANDPPRPTTQPFYGSERKRLCTLLYVTLKDRPTNIQDLGLFFLERNVQSSSFSP